METGPLKIIRKDTCGRLPPWFSRFGTREPGAPPAETKPKSSQRLAVQIVRSTLPSTPTVLRASSITPSTKPTPNETELVRQLLPLSRSAPPCAAANLH